MSDDLTPQDEDFVRLCNKVTLAIAKTLDELGEDEMADADDLAWIYWTVVNNLDKAVPEYSWHNSLTDIYKGPT